MDKSRHQCMIYDGSPASNLVRLVPQMIQKMADRNRCLFLGSPAMVAAMRVGLSAAGVDIFKEIEKGSLILSTDQSHLKNGRFDTERMLSMLIDAVEKAIIDGFSGLWASGDMTWEMGTPENLPKLLEYECGLEKLFRTLPGLSGVCQYHRDTLPLDIIGNALYTHRTVYINHTLQRLNPFYLQPEYLLSHTPPRHDSLELERMLREANSIG